MRRDEDVKKYVQDMILFKIGVEMDGLMRKVLDLLREILDRKLTSLDRLGFLKKWNGEPIASKEDLHKISQKHIIQLNREFVKSINEDRSKPDFDKSVYTALSINAEAMKLFHMLKTVETQGLNVLADYLDELKKESKKSAASKATKNLSADFMLRKIHSDLNHVRNGKSERLMHPKIFKLVHLLVEEQEKNPDLRVLVFTELRNTVGVIVSQLNLISGLKPAKFVGQARKSKTDKGLTQKEQIALLEKFKAGEFNILVSTSVAEEGLDIAECDMVVFYDAVPSEIRLIQRRGRTARNREGKVIILYCIGTADERYLNISMSKLKAMQRSLGANFEKSPKKSIVKKSRKTKKKESAGSNSQINEFLKVAQKEKVDKSNLKPPKNTNYISIDKNIPVRYGIRKGLKSKFQISELKNLYSSDFKFIYPDITVKNILSVKILNLKHLIKNFGEDPERLDEDLKNYGKLFELSIFFIDRMDVESDNYSSFDEIKNVIEKHDIQMIPSDQLEEIPLILNQIIKNIKNKYKIKV
jgi:ERCC4-related helicase